MNHRKLLADYFIKQITERPEDFLYASDCCIFDTKKDQKWWIWSGASFFRLHYSKGEYVKDVYGLIGRMPFGWQGTRCWWAYKRWTKRYKKKFLEQERKNLLRYIED